MKTLFDDLFRLRWSLAIFLVLAVFGVAAALVSAQIVHKARQDEQQAVAQVRDVGTRLSRIRDEADEIRSNVARFRGLVDRGVIGEEARLDWVEHIARIKSERRLFDVQYELAPQKPASLAIMPGGNSGGGFQFMASAMKLQMQLLDEDDLLGFLSDLRQSVPALLVVRGCAVERAPHNPSEHGVQPQLKADCDIDWITAREKP